jgi:hypothetical protein
MFTEKVQMRRVSAKFMQRLFTDDQKEKIYLAKHQTPAVPHPTCSPDLAPADIFLFPKI